MNEMLVQMEMFDGVFIASTNLMDDIDQAALRRAWGEGYENEQMGALLAAHEHVFATLAAVPLSSSRTGCAR